MSDRVLDRFVELRAGGRDLGEAGGGDVESPPHSGCFGFLRGTRDRAPMLELRRKDGRIRAISYSWLQSADFDPSQGISLRVEGQTIRITGRNLNSGTHPDTRLFSAICRHRVLWIQEAAGPDSIEAGPDATLIDRIDW